MSSRLLALLGLVLLAVLAGCSTPGSIRLVAVDDSELASEASVPVETLGDEGERLVRETVENGSATVNGTHPPVDTERYPVVVDDAYYDLSAEVVDSHTEVHVTAEVDYNGSTDGPAVAYEDLSAADRELVDVLVPPMNDHRVEGYDFGAGRTYTRAEAAESVLLSEEYAAIRHEGERYPIRVERREVEVDSYRYTATRVATNESVYADSLREQYAFTLAGLTDAEATLLEEAIGDGYMVESDDDETFRSLLDRFRAHDAVRSDEYEGEWVVRYRGTTYWAELRYDGFSE